MGGGENKVGDIIYVTKKSLDEARVRAGDIPKVDSGASSHGNNVSIRREAAKVHRLG